MAGAWVWAAAGDGRFLIGTEISMRVRADVGSLIFVGCGVYVSRTCLRFTFRGLEGC